MIVRTRTAELARLVDGLPARERRGSRPRCVLLTHGHPQRVADRLSALASPGVVVNTSDLWFPGGFEDPREITLGDCDDRLLERRHQDALSRWWVSTTGTLPTWDLVSTARAGKAKALLLAEAKAHGNELVESPRAPRLSANQATISRAIAEATTALDAVMPGWDLTHAPYQLANRVAWGWKLASLGVPVVLVYVGFLHATDMRDRGNWFVERTDWERTVRAYSQHAVPAEAWGVRLAVGDAWLQLQIRIAHVQLPRPCPICSAQLRWIAYGLPTDAMSVALDSGEYVLGRCLAVDDSPDHQCEQCGAPFRLDQWRRVGP